MFKLSSFAFLLLAAVITLTAQVDSGLKSFVSGLATDANEYFYHRSEVSADGRLIVFGSRGNLATFNPRNSDGNYEIFLLDVAQRHVFQITDTKNALFNPNGSPTEYANIQVSILNLQPSISNDGKWIAFGSNATTSVPASPPNGTNPGNFNGNTSGYLQILQQDANTELWLYRVPDLPPVDLSLGDLPTFVDLGTGTFTQVTNSPPSNLPRVRVKSCGTAILASLLLMVFRAGF